MLETEQNIDIRGKKLLHGVPEPASSVPGGDPYLNVDYSCVYAWIISSTTAHYNSRMFFGETNELL